MNKDGYENLEKTLKLLDAHKKIVIWGASSKSDSILMWFERMGISIYGFIDKRYDDIKKYKGYSVYAPEKLAEENFFVYIALWADYKEVVEWLRDLSYREFIDYWYPRRVIKLDGTTDYWDLYGNSLVSISSCPMTVKLRDGGKIQIRSKQLDVSTVIKAEGKAVVNIGEGVATGFRVAFSATNGCIEIGDKCELDSDIKFRVSCGGKISVSVYCTIRRQCALTASFDAKIILGKDCMISYSVYLRAGNSHNMIDLNTGEHLDAKANRDVILGEHVWCGMRATIMNGVRIGSGSTIGANSFVCKREFGENCCLAGNPAHVIRERTAWIRDGVRKHENIEDYTDFIYYDRD